MRLFTLRLFFPRLSVFCLVCTIAFGLPIDLLAADSADTAPADKAAADNTPADETESEESDEVEDSIPLAGHSDHGEAYNEGPRQNAYLMGGTGAVDFKITTENEEAQAFFDQGLGQLYGFWYYEAERSFRRVAALDPDCAMAYWGMARANDENRDRAKSFIAEAVEKKESASEREQMYITALEKYLTDDKEEKDRRKDYIKAIEKIIRKFPDDIEAKAMLAVHLWQSSRHGVPINSHQAIESLIADVFRTQPMHSAHHFRIHLWDHEAPEEALESAAKCGQSAPTIAHMWHMPGHIYSRLKRYNDAVFQQEASARADHAHMMRDGVLPDQIHNYAHNNEWMIRNLVNLGCMKEALSAAKNMLELPRHPKYNSFERDGMCSCKYGRRRLLQVLETFEMWDKVIELSDTMYLEPTDSKEEQGKRLRFLGLAHYHRGEFSKVKQCVKQLEELLEAFDKAAEKAGEEAETKKREELEKKAEEERDADEEETEKDKDQTEKDLDESKEDGAEKESEDDVESDEESDEESDKKKKETAEKEKKERDKKIAAARKKAERDARKGERSVKKSIDELNGVQFLARGKTDEAIEKFKKSDIPKTRLARYYFLAGDHKKATELCKEAVKSGENEAPQLATQVDLLRRMGKTDEAKKAFEDLRTVGGVADLDSPLFAKLAKFAEKQKWPDDWRTPAESEDDIGDRPKLDSLGPFRWAPSAATEWQLLDHEKKQVSLSDYRDRPVVVIFYLGAGCLHCVEQLHEFIPELPKFEEAGIDVVAISSETRKEMAKSVKDFSKDGEFPIRLLANPKLDVFKQYRAFDDFEEMALHGTFLIDGKGMIRWHDINYEPFLDVEFLLGESKRILSDSE